MTMPGRLVRVLLIGGLIATSAIVFGARRATPVADVALGFTAKGLCSSIFLGGIEKEQALDDLPDHPLLKVVRVRVDQADGTVSAGIPGVSRRTAAYNPSTGCTLYPVAGPRATLPVLAGTQPLSDSVAWQPWPEGRHVIPIVPPAFDADAVANAIDNAFAELDPSLPRNTRAVVIVHDGRIIAERYADGFSATTRFAGWSMTKSVTSALVGVLVGQGMLDIGQDALMPEWRGPDDPRRNITLDQLLRMSSGLDFPEDYGLTADVTRMLFAEPDAAAMAAARPLAAPPGTRWAYSSASSNIISRLLRDAVGGSLADYLDFPRATLFEPSGMRSAVMEPDPSGTFVGSSFMYATARDWARFGLLYLNDGVSGGQRILPEGWVDYSTRPAPAAPRGRYGAHWWLNAGAADNPATRIWPELPQDLFWASGYEGQYIAIVPSYDLVVVRLGLTPSDDAWRLDEFLRELLAAHIATTASTVAPHTALQG
jgi:CubicO group peptidase (beta-lactamase class C family)